MNANVTVLDDIPFAPDIPKLADSLGIAPESDERKEFDALAAAAVRTARPKVCFAEAPVELLNGDRVAVGGTPFTSRLLRDNLSPNPVAFPYLATCGRELHDLLAYRADPLEGWWGETLMREALGAAILALTERIDARTHPAGMADMNPGSLAEWPLSEQTPLFALLADGVARVGIALTESLLMVPQKSVSGVRFANAHGYVNCRLCPRDNCPNRRAPRDPGVGEMT